MACAACRERTRDAPWQELHNADRDEDPKETQTPPLQQRVQAAPWRKPTRPKARVNGPVRRKGRCGYDGLRVRPHAESLADASAHPMQTNEILMPTRSPLLSAQLKRPRGSPRYRHLDSEVGLEDEEAQ